MLLALCTALNRAPEGHDVLFFDELSYRALCTKLYTFSQREMLRRTEMLRNAEMLLNSAAEKKPEQPTTPRNLGFLS